MIGKEFTTHYGDEVSVCEAMAWSITYIAIKGKGEANGTALASLNAEEIVKLRDLLNERIAVFKANGALLKGDG